jgi:DNA-binding NtrC family response regulator
MLSIMLETQGYEVLCAPNGKEALALLYVNPVALVLSDIKMPQMDGIEFLGKVKSQFPDIEVIIMTAYVSVETAIEAMRRGAYDYLTKPITDISRTKLVIQKALEKSRVQLRTLPEKRAASGARVRAVSGKPADARGFRLIARWRPPTPRFSFRARAEREKS